MKLRNIGLLLTISISMAGCFSIPNSVEKWREGLSYQKIGDFTVAYKTYGDKSNPAVILLHGLPTSSYLYRNIAPKVAAKGYYVITPDMVGFGASSKPDDYLEYDVKLQSERIKQLLSQLNINSYNVVAHDLGGLVGFELLVDDSSKINSFLILNTTVYKEGFTPPPEMDMLAGWMGGLMSSMMSNGVSGPFLTGKFITDNMGHPERLTDEAKDNYWWPVHEGATIPMRSTAKSFDKIMARYPVYQAALRKYQGHSQILWGAKDVVLKFDKLVPQFSKDLNLSAEKVKHEDEAGHFIQEDFPDVVTDNILELLTDSRVASR